MNIFEGLKAVPNVHPLFVHFPIALLLIAVYLFFAGIVFRKDEFLISAKWNLLLGSIFGIITVITGFLAESTLPHNQEIHQAMEIHEKIMITTVILALGLAGYLFYKKDLACVREQVFFRIGLIIMAVLLAVGADYGGKMVFKYGAGTELFIKANPDAGHDHDHEQGEAHEHGATPEEKGTGVSDKKTGGDSHDHDDHDNHDHSDHGH